MRRVVITYKGRAVPDGIICLQTAARSDGRGALVLKRVSISRWGLFLGLVLLLSVLQGVVLGACSEAEPDTTSTSAAASTDVTAAPPTTVAPSVTTIPPTTSTTMPVQESVVLEFATTLGEHDEAGRVIRHFCDRVEESTAGAFKFYVHFDGLLGGATEELRLVRSGSVDLVFPEPSMFPDQVPLLSSLAWRPGTQPGAEGYPRDLVFGEQDTASLIQEEAAIKNAVILGFGAGDANVFLTREGAASLSELAGRRFYAGRSAAALEALGCTVEGLSAAETYEGLSGGAVDAVHSGLGVATDMKWYEVTPYLTFDGVYGTGRVFMINRDTWNELPAAVQAKLYEAADDTAEFATELRDGRVDESVGRLEERGVVVNTLGPEDAARWWELFFRARAAAFMDRAARLGIVEDMMVVLAAAAKATGVVWPEGGRLE